MRVVEKKKKVVCGVGVIAPGGVLHPIIDRFLYYYYCASLITWTQKKSASCNLNKHLEETCKGRQLCSVIGIWFHCVVNATSSNTEDIILSPSSSLLMITYFVKPLNFSECLNSLN